MSSIPEKTEAARREEEERMEIERGVKLLDTSMEDTTDQDGKRSRVDSLSSHFVKICGLGSAEVFEPEDSTHPPPSAWRHCPPQLPDCPTLTAWPGQRVGTGCQSRLLG